MNSPTDSAPDERNDVLAAAAGLLAEGEIDSAAKTLFDAWSANPGNRDLAVSYASLLAQAGREAEAEELFACLADEMPDDSRVWNNWGYLLLTRGEADLALAKLSRALELSPSDFEATVNMGIALDRLGRAAEALDFHRRAAEANPDSPVVFNNMGAALWRAGRKYEALEAFRKALALNPRDASAANNMGVIRLEAGEHAEAEGYFRQALSIDPASRAARRNLREIHRKKRLSAADGSKREGGREKGLMAFRHAQELNAGDSGGILNAPDETGPERREKCREKPPSLF